MKRKHLMQYYKEIKDNVCDEIKFCIDDNIRV